MNLKAALRSPWTTAGGAVTALGLGLQTQVAGLPDWTQTLAIICIIAGPVMMGIAARDSGTSSEAAGVRKAGKAVK